MARDHFPPIQDGIYGVPYLREALANAEARYQAGGPGVTEEEIVTFHNRLVDILGLPDYAKLDQAQVRHSRMIILRMLLDGTPPKPGESQTELTHTLSPMAASILEDHLIEQKRFNAGYQMAPGEWTEQKKHEHARTQMADLREKRDSGVDHSKEIDQKLRAKGSLSLEESTKLLSYVTETFKLSVVDTAKIAARFGP
jgi:hypothetical protein